MRGGFIRNLSLVCCFLLLIITSVKLQYAFESESGNLGNYRLRHFNSDNGLPQNSVKGMEFDTYGNLWLGTEGGLVMFDGINFRTEFNINTGIRIHELIKTSEGLIVYYDSKDNVYLIDEKTGTIEFGNYDNKIKFKNNSKYLLEAIPNSISDTLTVNGVNLFLRHRTSDMQYYLKTWEDDFIYFDSTRIVQLEADDKYQTFKAFGEKFFCFSQKDYKIYENSELQRTDDKVYDFHTKKTVDLDLTKAFFFLHPQQPFVFHEGTLYEMSYTNEHLYFKKLIENLPDFVPLKHATYDPKQKIWAFGSHLIGMFLVQQSPIRSALLNEIQNKSNTESQLYAGSIGTILELQDGGKMTNIGYIYYADGRCEKFEHSVSEVFALFKDSKGNIFAPDFKNKRVNIFDQGLRLQDSFHFTEFFRSIYQFSETQLLVLTYRTLIMLYPQENYRYEILYENYDLYLNKLFKYDEDEFWLLSTEGIFEIKNNFKEISVISGTEHKYMRHCGRLSNGEMLVFSYGDGYFMYKDDKMIPLPMDKDGYLKFAHYFLEDKNGYLWIPTNKGLFQLSVEDIMAYARGELTNVYYNYYDKTYGFYNNEFNGGGNQPGMISEIDGYYWMGNLVGPVLLDPYIHTIPLPVNPIRIQSIELADSILYNVGEYLEFRPDFNRITFTVSSADFGHPNNLRMEYRLIGSDTKWYPIEAGNSFSITNLSKGDYELEVRKLKGFGKDNYDLVRYSFTVLPHVYETWWFLILLCIVIFLGIMLLIQLRTLQLNRRNFELEKLVKERTKTLENSILNLERASEKNELMISIITHDIKGPLKFISQVMNNMSINLNKLTPENLKPHFATLSDSTSKLYHFVLEFIQWFQMDRTSFDGHATTEFSLMEALGNIKDFAYATGIAKNNKLIIDENTDIVITNRRPLVETIFRNLIENACKNTHNGEILISGELLDSGKMVRISFRDTGAGMTAEQIEKIYEMDKLGRVYFENRFHLGYGLIFNLLKEIGGEIKIESEPGKGTLVQIAFPPII